MVETSDEDQKKTKKRRVESTTADSDHSFPELQGSVTELFEVLVSQLACGSGLAKQFCTSTLEGCARLQSLPMREGLLKQDSRLELAHGLRRLRREELITALFDLNIDAVRTPIWYFLLTCIQQRQCCVSILAAPAHPMELLAITTLSARVPTIGTPGLTMSPFPRL